VNIRQSGSWLFFTKLRHQNLRQANSEEMDHQNQLPHFLYRAFQTLEHAKNFVEHGQFRMGLLDSYTQTKDERRRDSSEGIAQVKVLGIEHSSENFNCKYLRCCSDPEVDLDYMKRRFGEYIVKINDPPRLAQDVTAWLQNRDIPDPDVEWKKVRYDKGLSARESLTNSQFAELSYTQKRAKILMGM